MTYADPYKVESFFSAMEDGLLSETHRQTMVERGRECVAQFTWERSTGRLLNVFSELLEARATAALAKNPRRIRQVAAAAAIAIAPHAGSRDKR